MTDFHAAAARFGKVGKLYIAPLGTTEPTSVSSAWPAGWWSPGLTDTGSNWTYNTPRTKVYAAELKEAIGSAADDLEIMVQFSLLEFTKRNLDLAINRAVTTPDNQNWTWESATADEVDNPTYVMLGWDAYQTVASNDLRIIFRRTLNNTAIDAANRKGAEKALLNMNFDAFATASGDRAMKIWGGGGLNPS